MFKNDFKILLDSLREVDVVDYDGLGSMSRNILSKSIVVDLNKCIPVTFNDDVKEKVNIALNELDFIVSMDQNNFLSLGKLHPGSHLNNFIVNDDDFKSFSENLTDEYLSVIEKEDYIDTVGYHNSQNFRMVMRTVPLTFYDINIPIAKDYINKLAGSLYLNDEYKTLSEEDKKEYLSKIELQARESFIDPLTEIVYDINKGLKTPLVVPLYNFNTRRLPVSEKGYMAFLGRSESIYNVTHVEFINLKDTLHLSVNLIEMNLDDNPFKDIIVMSALLITMANITNKKVGKLTVNIGRLYTEQTMGGHHYHIRSINMEMNSKLTCVSEIGSDKISYEII